MSFMDKVRSWWRKDDLAETDEETRMTPKERDVAEEDYEGRKDDLSIETTRAGGALTGSDFERDSERPQ